MLSVFVSLYLRKIKVVIPNCLNKVGKYRKQACKIRVETHWERTLQLLPVVVGKTA